MADSEQHQDVEVSPISKQQQNETKTQDQQQQQEKKQDPSLEKPPAAPNNNKSNTSSAAAQQQQDSFATLEDPSNSFAPFLEERAQKALREERWKDALNDREHVLRCYLRAFGEQSNEANLQKQLLAALILKAGDFEKNDNNNSSKNGGRSTALNTSSASAGGGGANSSTNNTASPARTNADSHRPKNLLSSMFGASPVGDLTMSSRLEYAQMLLSPNSIGPILSEEPNLRHLRARLMIAHSTITSRLHRPRSAIPMLTEAMRLLQGLILDTKEEEERDEYGYADEEDGTTKRKQTLSPGNHEAARLELCECYLTKAVLLSNCQKHEESLATAMWGLAAILQLEEESWRNFQDLHGRDMNAPRARIFHASLQAACHHNIGAEQEHLGLTELALDSYETGFELAVSCFGIQHPMSERLKTCYSELFSSLHYKHFVRNGEQRDVAKQALRDPEIAIAHLRASYYASERHRAALSEQTKKQTRMLARAGTDASLSKNDSMSNNNNGRSSKASSRANSAKRRRPASSKNRPMTATKQA